VTASFGPSDPSTPSCDRRPPGTRRFFPGLRLGFLGLMILAFYHQLWWPDRILVKRDATMTFLPVKQYMLDRLRSGELPEWFPYDALGRSFIGVAITGVFHPFTLLYFLFPAADALRLSVLLSCLLAAGGAFWLGRHLGLSATGSLLAGFAFACSGYVVSMTENIQYLYSICLVPLMLLALDRALADRLEWTAAAAALWATVFLNGDIQTGYYFAFVALLWAVMRAPGSLPRVLRTLSGVAGLTALLAGIQLGPSLMVFLGSNLRHSPIFQEFVLQWSTHPLRLLTMLAWPVSTESEPGVIMGLFFDNVAITPWAESLYLGVPLLGLALFGARRRRDLRVFTALGLLALLLALGRHGGLYDIFRHTIPLWSVFRYPEKWMGFVSLSAAMLAGAGLDALRADQRHAKPWLTAACLCVGAGLFLVTATAQTLLAIQYETTMKIARDVAETSARAWLISGVAAGGVGLLIGAAEKHWLRVGPLLAGIVAITAMDLTAANARAYFTAPRAVAEFTPPFLRTLTAREGALAPGRFRVATLHFGDRISWPSLLEERIGYHGAGAIHYRQALNGGLNTEFGIEGFRSSLPGAHPAVDVINRLHAYGVYARMNVSYFVDLRSRITDQRLADSLVEELPEYDLVLARNPVPAKPRAYLSRKPEPASAPPAPDALFTRPDFLSGDVDVIETSDALPGAAAAGQAVVERYAPERVVVRTEAPAPAVLVLVDAFDPGWRAALDTGEALPILRANILTRAVVVPAGVHRVTFSYHTPLLKAGAGASATGVILSLALIGFAWRRRHEHPAGPKEPGHVSTTVG
jgi:hypothetical protein